MSEAPSPARWWTWTRSGFDQIDEDLQLALELPLLQRVASDGVALVKIVDDQPHPDAPVEIGQALSGGAAGIGDAREDRYSVPMDLAAAICRA